MTSTNADVAAILARRGDNGADYWATTDGRIYVGNPFSTISSLGMLHELGVGADHEAVEGGIDLILAATREDGRIRVGPRSPMYPCYTAEAARTLCRFGLSGHESMERVIAHFLESAHESGGWRCSFTKLGKGPGTEVANPGATLYVLDVLRFAPELREGEAVVVDAVDSLLAHWETRAPVGPCQHGIGSRFLRLEYPFLRYNLFYYTYVLSFYGRATGDPRFQEALSRVEERVDGDGRVVVEDRHRGLSKLEFCAKGKPSEGATRRFQEIVENVGRSDTGGKP